MSPCLGVLQKLLLLLQTCCKGAVLALPGLCPVLAGSAEAGEQWLQCPCLGKQEAPPQKNSPPSTCHAPLSSLYVLGKGKALASRAVKGGHELVLPCRGVQAGAGLRVCFSKCNSFVRVSPGKSLTGDTPVLTFLIKH